MAINFVKNAFNEMGHIGLDILHGENTTQLRHDLNDAASLFKIIGIITTVASGILAILALTSSCWFLAPITLIPIILGIEMTVVSDNIKEIVNNCISRGTLALYIATHSEEEVVDYVYAIATEGTLIMKCFCQPLSEDRDVD